MWLSQQKRQFTLTALAPLLVLMPIIMIQPVRASEFEMDDWYVSRHGPVVSCHSLSKREDGTYQLDRYLFVSRSVDVGINDTHKLNDDLSKEQKSYNGLIEKLLNDAGRSSKNGKNSPQPFFHESYNLNSRYHIIEGDITKGSLDLDANTSLEPFHTDNWQPSYCVDLHRQVSNMTILSRQYVFYEKPRWEFIAVKGEGEKTVADEIKLLDIADGSTPLIMVVRGSGSDYSSVFDPFYRLNSIAMSYEDYRPFSHDHILFYKTFVYFFFSISVYGGFVSMTNPLAGIPIIILSMNNAYLNMMQMTDWRQTSESKAEKKRNAIKDEHTRVRQHLADLKTEYYTQQIQLQRYGLSSYKDDLYAITQDLQEEQKQHLQEIAEQESLIDNLKQIMNSFDKARREELSDEQETVAEKEKADKRQKDGFQDDLNRLNEQLLVLKQKNQKTYVKPLTLLNAFENNKKLIADQEQLKNELAEQMDTADVYVHLMTLVKNYKNYQRISREESKPTEHEEQSSTFESADNDTRLMGAGDP